jgi:hypothetical protein
MCEHAGAEDRRLRIPLAIVLVLTALGGGVARAQDRAAAIQAVITEQIEAFRSQDPVAAFAFASPAVKRNFPNPKRFLKMVQDDYPMVWRPRTVRFSGLIVRRGRPVQGVIVLDQAGALHILDFEMIEGQTGWLINGVRHRRGDAAAA